MASIKRIELIDDSSVKFIATRTGELAENEGLPGVSDEDVMFVDEVLRIDNNFHCYEDGVLIFSANPLFVISIAYQIAQEED